MFSPEAGFRLTRISKYKKHTFPEINGETQIPLFLSPIPLPRDKSLGGRWEQVAEMPTVGMMMPGGLFLPGWLNVPIYVHLCLFWVRLIALQSPECWANSDRLMGQRETACLSLWLESSLGPLRMRCIGNCSKFSFTYLFQVPVIAFPPLCQVLRGEDKKLCWSWEAREHSHQDLVFGDTGYLQRCIDWRVRSSRRTQVSNKDTYRAKACAWFFNAAF